MDYMETEDMEVDEMEIDKIVDVDMEPNDLGIEDYGNLISSNAKLSFCSKEFMTPVSDQLDIDSCIPFTLCAYLGALVVLENPHIRDVPEFSKQDMVDCLPVRPGGITFTKGYDYILHSGLHLEKDYPYSNKYDVCRCSEIQGRPKHSISSYKCIPKGDVLMALHRHPITAGIHLFESFEQHQIPYRSRADLLGVYEIKPGELPKRDPKGNCEAHSILVVGYGVDPKGNCEAHSILVVGYGVDANGKLYFIIAFSGELTDTPGSILIYCMILDMHGIINYFVR